MPTQTGLKQWIQDLLINIDNKNTEEFSSFLTDDVKFRFGNMPTTNGKPATIEQVNFFFDSIKSLKHIITDCWSQDNSITSHGTVTYTRHDNSTLTVPFCNLFKTNEQGIYEYLIFADVSALYTSK